MPGQWLRTAPSMPNAPTPQMIAIEEMEIEYIYVPPSEPNAPTVLFLHEGLGSLALWRDTPRRLLDGLPFGSLIYSRHGNGFSSSLTRRRTVTYMHEEAALVLPALLGRLGIERTLLIGHSDGASIALLFAANYERHCVGLVVEAPHLFVEPVSLSAIAAIRDRYGRDGEFRSAMARHHRDVDTTFFGWNDIWLDNDFASWNIEAHVARIAVPMLAIQGADDEYGSFAQIERLAELTQGN
ncbi:MAG TPA: alpha/beta hydrolase, partial [Candidatus Dormibacteraeota bacterium]|nr:alpha/beta hydrolase [Candidatus Dormibacteraeota bacterium]